VEVVPVVSVESAPTTVSPYLTLIVPTRNEAAGIGHLLDRLDEAVNHPGEVIVIDDSDDTTPFEVRLRLASAVDGPRRSSSLTVRLLHRPPGHREGGLGTAVKQGMALAAGTWICVLDADLQHPPETIDEMVATAEREDLDLVVASRYASGASMRMSPARRGVSKTCAVAARALFPVRLREVSDPLSGFFLVRRAAIDIDALEPQGFKILLEILGRHPGLRIGEVGFDFADRYAGVSKASTREAVRYGRQLVALRRARPAPVARRSVAHYDIHGIVTVASDVVLPELKWFRTRSVIDEPDITVSVGPAGRGAAGGADLIDLTDLVPHIRYAERFGDAGFAVDVDAGDQIRVTTSAFVASSPHVVYTNIVEPILRWTFVSRGYALVHAAGFVHEGLAHLITARTDTGKTTTMLKILEHGPAFISDDLVLVDRAGVAYTYPKPLTISAHTVAALRDTDLNRLERFFLPAQSRLHSRSGRRLAFLLTERGLPVATINAGVQRLVPPPKYRVDKLVPGVRVERLAPVASLTVITAGPTESMTTLAREDGLRLLKENCEDAFGFPPYDQLARLLTRDQRGRELGAVEDEIVASALADVPLSLATSDRMGWAELVWDHISGSTPHRAG
jgi:hypothetical protein